MSTDTLLPPLPVNAARAAGWFRQHPPALGATYDDGQSAVNVRTPGDGTISLELGGIKLEANASLQTDGTVTLPCAPNSARALEQSSEMRLTAVENYVRDLQKAGSPALETRFSKSGDGFKAIVTFNVSTLDGRKMAGLVTEPSVIAEQAPLPAQGIVDGVGR